MPEPRSIVVYSGERIQADRERMAEIEQWLNPELDRINLDPAFLIRVTTVGENIYPWDGLEITADTADIRLAGLGADAETPYLVYGYLHLMDSLGTLVEVFPEAEGQAGYGLERTILERIAEVWILGRSVFDTQPYGPLDELLYSYEFGYLDEYIFATQGDRFGDAAADYRAEFPSGEEAFRSWFLGTFEADGPRYVRVAEDDEEQNGPAGDVDSAS